MKKLLLTIAIVTTFGLTAMAQRDAFFSWNDADNEMYRDIDNGINFTLPTSHGLDYDNTAPLGSGLLILTALGTGYVIRKRRR